MEHLELGFLVVARRAGEDDGAVLQNDHAIREAFELLEVLRRKADRSARDRLPEPPPLAGIERRRRFVEQQGVGLAEQ